MKKMLNFAKRNMLEVIRDPISYIFGLGFPIVLLIMFTVINSYTANNTPMFDLTSLLPGIIMFSFTFIMLLMALLVSKDRTSSLLRRLYTSPIKTSDFILGYALIGIILGLIQEIIGLLGGFIISLIIKESYFSFTQVLLLFLSQIPMLLICVFLGLLFGAALNDKAAPGICSFFISAAGVLGGCWMPLDVMGDFETFCRFLPFYPSVYLGRIVVNASHTNGEIYTFNTTATLGIITIFVYLAIFVILSCWLFSRQKKRQ
jgi:ABC-2 type transport system permease protein